MASPLLQKLSPKSPLSGLKRSLSKNLPSINGGGQRRSPATPRVLIHDDKKLNDNDVTKSKSSLSTRLKVTQEYGRDILPSPTVTSTPKKAFLASLNNNCVSQTPRSTSFSAFSLKKSGNSPKLFLPGDLKPKFTSPDSPPLLFIRYSTTDACNALVQSPCRLDNYHQQRKLLYKDNFDDNYINNDLSIAINTGDSSITPKLGKGGFGSVFIGKYGGKPVAIKQLHAGHKEKVNGESLCAELNAFRLKHDNIVKILTFCLSGSIIQIVFEYVGRRTLQTVLDDPVESIDFDRRKTFCTQLASALAYCHERRVLHLDVKPSNVLLADGPVDVCKLADFGCSRILPQTQTPMRQFQSQSVVVTDSAAIVASSRVGARKMSSTSDYKSHTPLTASTPSFAGTLIYKAPELLRGMAASIKCDVYSYAYIIWQLVTRRQPFDHADQHTVVFCVVAKNLRPSIRPGMDFSTERDEKLLDLAKQCWDCQPELRPEFRTISRILENL